ncbi:MULTISPECIES: hydroxyethylthiazole kinase [Alphaproteobacteria]|uniref:Hydroxyethylthiazole kinase n=2 Tax=Alphaproteobacteria TaxID=28211 RepID=A0A512HE13_9HYPH|nr:MULTISPECIES: hydroxyethylthiazole kinase [Alphaproteobacteria]GEO83684.1 hydroxyethylthiazole kinase [Ciceribacter naphthalenivorans]GLR24164.1 hydroxyethylthiazole kinase [Ciceribacter naphthalenivorans]GLT07020.1 hydroxyethylthiazole kinase [Sphingomonas psychrolutea]
MTKAETFGTLLDEMRATAPLVQCITNYVAMNIAANVLLAAGGSPAMVHAQEEAGEFAGFAGALTVNIGTLSPTWVDGMKAAIGGAVAARRPWVLDPVAHFATGFRRKVTADLLALGPTVVRGNASEIIALAGGVSSARGVDSRDPVEQAEEAARWLAHKQRCIVAVTGATDLVTDGNRATRIEGGSPLMPKVTALGCSLTCLVGAYAAIRPQDPFGATVAALTHFAVAGEQAGKQSPGPGSFAVGFLDLLAEVDGVMLDKLARVVRL